VVTEKYEGRATVLPVTVAPQEPKRFQLAAERDRATRVWVVQVEAMVTANWVMVEDPDTQDVPAV
jgi:hypothetical protein